MDELLEQKGILAKLMATENITVRHAKVPTAGSERQNINFTDSQRDGR